MDVYEYVDVRVFRMPFVVSFISSLGRVESVLNCKMKFFYLSIVWM